MRYKRRNRLASSRIIKTELFKALDDSTPHVKKVFRILDDPDWPETHYSEYLENIDLAKEALRLFLDAFYLQFFRYGYKLGIESIEGASKAINAIRDGQVGPRPEKMIASFNDYYANIFLELPEIGYGGGNHFVLRTAFCSTLPQLFIAFRKEGQGIVTNFNEIVGLMNSFMTTLKVICRKEPSE